jgi:hypothetical protein
MYCTRSTPLRNVGNAEVRLRLSLKPKAQLSAEVAVITDECPSGPTSGDCVGFIAGLEAMTKRKTFASAVNQIAVF